MKSDSKSSYVHNFYVDSTTRFKKQRLIEKFPYINDEIINGSFILKVFWLILEQRRTNLQQDHGRQLGKWVLRHRC